MRFGFVTGANEHPLSIAGSEKCVNWVPERTPEALKYVPRPGLDTFAIAGTGRRRASFEQNGRAFVVTGGSLYELAQDGTATLRGTVGQLGDDGLPASIAGNGEQGGQLCIISAGLGYIFDLALNTLAVIADPQFPANARMVVYLNGHFIIIPKDSFTFQLSAQYDGTSYVAADNGEKSKTTDRIQAVVVDEDSGELWLIGTQLSEVWRYTGTAGFPLDPVDTIVPIGTAASFGWTTLGGSIYGLGQSKSGERIFLRFSGYGFERLSTHAVERAVQGYTEAQIAHCEAFAFELAGHRYVLFTFVDANATWVYDEATQLWTRWDHWDSDRQTSEAFLAVGHLFAFGQHLAGSHQDGTVYVLSHSAADDNGDVIRRVGRGPRIHAEGKRVMHHALTLDCQLGVGDATTTDPVALIRWSDDVGKTWGPEQRIPLGAQGAYAGRAQLRRLGLAGFQGRIYEVVITDPVITAIADVFVELGAAA